VSDGLHAQRPQALGDPPFGPAIGGMTRPPYALGEDLRDPAEDRVLGRDEIVAHASTR
jgi:hypothetical protein